ncbi:hypothetical protein SAMN04490182_3512 [Pseudomonas cedrina]|uniref:Uncharacterized protein n=2 Tax=Pseudomonas cedrina TaxID=651740 RepID=A0A1V2JX25_PSECE|nr:hypothetical protein [Pseudomonas cedrina]ONH49675.1 hypothetical protein BLL36_28660 [Pseudomonas cedrina subsp. cedrina]SDT17348.1 hypothetical protein SAMN04490182_3512 [Pseudomonas cedrina]
MCIWNLQVIYFLFLSKEGVCIPLLEKNIKYVESDLIYSEDFLRNESIIYRDLFSEECIEYIYGLVVGLMNEMRTLTFEESKEALDGLSFLQGVGATALWKFNCNLKLELESFVREFDRLDVVEERERLYLLAQEK